MGSSILRLLGLWALWIGYCGCQDNSFVLSSFSRPESWLRPYDWTYLRVELPPWFSSVVMVFESDVDIDKDHVNQLPQIRLPVICIKDGSPPLPDVSDTFLDSLLSNSLVNGSLGGTHDLLSVEQCIPFQKNLTATLTNEQQSKIGENLDRITIVSASLSRVWYVGFFNGLGPARTQSKMINRGRAYMFSTSIYVRGCATSTIWGLYCNQTVDMISCSQSSIDNNSRRLLDVSMYNKRAIWNHLAGVSNHPVAGYHLPPEPNNIEGKQAVSNSTMFTAENLITCGNSIESSCLGYGEFKLYYLDIVLVASQFEIITTDFKLNQNSFVNDTAVFNGIRLMCYARYNAMPLGILHNQAADISKEPLVIKSPKIGRWYVAVQVVNQTKTTNEMEETDSKASFCFSFKWNVHNCHDGRAGLNCTWEGHTLQRVPRRGSSIPFESYYLPIDEHLPMENADFPLEHLLSNSSVENDAWTYFFLDVPHGTAGANMHVLLTSDTKSNYEVYSKYGGIASFDTWDYYVNSTSSSNGSSLLALNDSREERIDFYILYVKEGLWCIGLKHPPVNRYKQQTTMSITLEGCPRHCSSNGQCHYSVDGSGLTFYSYCACDRDHGGFDCSKELVSPEGHIWQSVFLIASNAAAILPAFWALRQKAFSEWVLFTSSGISSGLYHACDVGTWCALSFHVLQFMDFWLSFMAVVSTFIYMSTIDEASKRAIHTVVAVVTALLAVTGATRSQNIVLVIAIGTLGLLIGWLLEFSTSYRSIFCQTRFDLNIHERWQNIKTWFWNLMTTLRKRFRWPLVVVGFIALAFAATSWKLETNESYWIWHSLWHITIYTSSFFFLCSTSVKSGNEHQPAEYELTRQDSSSRTE